MKKRSKYTNGKDKNIAQNWTMQRIITKPIPPDPQRKIFFKIWNRIINEKEI